MNTLATTPSQAPTRASWIMVATLGFVWGGTFLGIELALRGITPYWLAAGRLVFAAGLLSVVFFLRGGRIDVPKSGPVRWPQILLVGCLSSSLPFTLLSWGQQYVTSGFAGVSMAAVALIMLPLAHLFVPGEQLTWRKSLGFIIGFVGVVVLTGGQALGGNGQELENFGRMACLGAAGCYAVSGVMMRRIPPIDPLALTTLLMIVGACISVPLALFVEGPPPVPPRDALITLAILGLIPTAAANVLRVFVIRSAGPTFMSLTNYLVPVWSVILGTVILGEPLPASLLLALGLILGGIAISQWAALRSLFQN